MIQNGPFKPFYPLDSLPCEIGTWEAICDMITGILNNSTRVAIVTGPTGVGKSSFARTSLINFLHNQSIVPVPLSTSSYLDPELDFSVIVSQLGIRTNAIGGILSDHDSGSVQRTGDVTNNESTKLIQMVATSSNPQTKSSYEAQLLALSSQIGKPICFVLDQAEYLFLQRKAASFSFLKALIRSSCVSNSNISCVIIIKDNFIRNIMQLLNQELLHHCQTIYFPGITEDEAYNYSKQMFKKEGIRISNSKIKNLIINSSTNGWVWPVELQANLERYFDVLVNKKPTVQKSDRPISALATSVRKRLKNLVGNQYQDSLHVLSRISQLTFVSGPQSLDELCVDINAYSKEDLSIYLYFLCELGLLEEVKPKIFSLRHDSLQSAIIELRSDESEGQIVHQIDRQVSDWIDGNEISNIEILRGYYFGSESRVAPTPHVICFGINYFKSPSSMDKQTTSLLCNRLSNIPLDSAKKILKSRSQRLGFAGKLGPDSIYILVTIGTEDSIKCAIEELVENELSVGLWNEPEFVRSFLAATSRKILTALALTGIHKIPYNVLRVLVTAIILQPREDFFGLDLIEPWLDNHFTDQESLVLRLFDYLDSDKSLLLAERLVSSSNVEDSLLSLSIICKGDKKKWVPIFEKFYKSDDLELRRGCYYCLTESNFQELSTDFIATFSNESSPLVREAILENSTKLSNVRAKKLIILGMSDEIEFVRESAVYASTHIFDKSELLDVVTDLFGDPSYLVREALLHVIERNGYSIPSALLLRDIKNGPLTLKAQAINLVRSEHGPDTTLLLSDIISDPASDSMLRIASIKSAQSIKHPSFIKSVQSLLSFCTDLDVISESIKLLEILKGDLSEILLCNLARHCSPNVREQAVYSLSRFEGRKVEQTLLSAVLDTDPVVQARALYGLGRCSSKSALPIIEGIRPRTSELERAIIWYRDQFSK